MIRLTSVAFGVARAGPCCSLHPFFGQGAYQLYVQLPNQHKQWIEQLVRKRIIAVLGKKGQTGTVPAGERLQAQAAKLGNAERRGGAQHHHCSLGAHCPAGQC